MENWKNQPGRPPEGYTVNHDFVEVKSSRLSMLLRPSLRAKAEKLAAAEGISLTDLIHKALAEYIADREDARPWHMCIEGEAVAEWLSRHPEAVEKLTEAVFMEDDADRHATVEDVVYLTEGDAYGLGYDGVAAWLYPGRRGTPIVVKLPGTMAEMAENR